MRRLRLYFSSLLLGAMLLASCSTGAVSFVSVFDLPNSVWESDQWVEFDFKESDTLSKKRINIIVRHAKDFEYDKLPLEVRTINPTKQFWCDTITIPLTDSNGEWLGRDMTTHCDLSKEYRRGVIFTHGGDYNIRIRQLYPTDSLTHGVRGIEAIGITIEKEANN